LSKTGAGVEARPLGIWRLIATAFGGVIGSGWLLAGFNAARIAGSKSVLSWILGGIAVLIIALVMADVGSLVPKSGGIVWWPFHSSGRLVGTIVAAGVWIFYAANPPSEALAMVTFLNSRGVFSGHLMNGGLTIWGAVWALAFMVVFVALNMFGVAWFARVNTAVTVSKFVVPVVTVVLLWLSFRTRHVVSHATIGPADPGWTTALSAIVAGGVIYAYSGFQAPLDHAGEARRPQDIRRAVLISVVLSIVVYTALQLVFILALRHSALGSAADISRSSPYLQLAGEVNLTWLVWMIMADSIASPAGSSLVFVSAMAQEVAQFGLNRIVPHWLADRSGRRQVLAKAMAVDFAIGCALLAIGNGSWVKIAALSSALSLFVYAMAAIPCTAFRHQAGTGLHWPGKALAPCSFVLSTVILFAAGWTILWHGIGLMAGLAAVLYGFRWKVPDARRPADLRGGVWLLSYLAALLLLSGLSGPYRLAGRHLIGAHYGIPLAVALGALAYAWGVRDAQRYLSHYPVALPVGLPAPAQVPLPRPSSQPDTVPSAGQLSEPLPPPPEAPPRSAW
jgi:amino acid transporter